MSEVVALRELAETLRRYGFAYLATVGDDQRAHLVAVTPVLRGGELHVERPGRRTCRNLARQPAVTLVWPPAEPGGYSLIVDGAGSLDGDVLTVVPVRAVLHRPAQPSFEPASGSCASDCVELPVPELPVPERARR